MPTDYLSRYSFILPYRTFTSVLRQPPRHVATLPPRSTIPIHHLPGYCRNILRTLPGHVFQRFYYLNLWRYIHRHHKHYHLQSIIISWRGRGGYFICYPRVSQCHPTWTTPKPVSASTISLPRSCCKSSSISATRLRQRHVYMTRRARLSCTSSPSAAP